MSTIVPAPVFKISTMYGDVHLRIWSPTKVEFVSPWGLVSKSPRSPVYWIKKLILRKDPFLNVWGHGQSLSEKPQWRKGDREGYEEVANSRETLKFVECLKKLLVPWFEQNPAAMAQFHAFEAQGIVAHYVERQADLVQALESCKEDLNFARKKAERARDEYARLTNPQQQATGA